MSPPSPPEALSATLVAPIVFLMAVVVLYGCLLVVLAHRVRQRQSPRRREAQGPMIDGYRRDGHEAQPALIPSSPDRTPVRLLIVVARWDPARYQELRRIFGDAGNTDVIFDRRQADPRAYRLPTPMVFGHAERRQRRIDDDLRMTGWALLRLTG